MLSGWEYFKTLCPVCEMNYMLKDFKLHLEKHKEFCELAGVNDQTYKTIYDSTSLRNVVNHVYYNWDYHIQTKYKPTVEDKRNYRGVRIALKQSNTPFSPQNVL